MTGRGVAPVPDLRRARTWFRTLALVAATGLALVAALVGGCDTARVLAPEPPLAAASVALYAVDVALSVPLDRASAEDPARYAIYPAGNPAARATIASATLVDTVTLRVVQLVMPDWFADSSFDRVSLTVETHGVRDWFGATTGDRSLTFRSGLGYADGMGAFFDARCSACHGSGNPGGGYRTDSYASLFGPGTSPTPNLIAGDPRCLLVLKCKPGNSMYTRAGLDFLDYERLVNWVSVYGARP